VKLALAGGRALVTGASRGVGSATALLLARAGADVTLAFRKRREDAEAVADEARRHGARAWACAADLRSETEVDALVAGTVERFGGLDIAVINAGVWPPDGVPLGQMSRSQWLATLDANLTSAFLTARAVARAISDGGRIVFVSSTAGQRGEPFHADYAASKGGMISLTKSLAVELAPRGVTVNCVAPGWIDTEMVEQPLADGGRAAIEAGIPLGRIASPEDVAGPIVFLCSDLARHITGEILNVNGGSVLCG
jgi:3-oxoacyl-[acyl-carrier protein] reductase